MTDEYGAYKAKVKLYLVLFFISTVLLRACSLYKAGVYSLEGYEKVYSALDITLGIAVIFSYALALCAIVLAARNAPRRAAISVCFISCAVILADRVFCIVWDVASSNISLGQRGAFSDAALWLTVDFLFFALTFFASLVITRFFAKKSGTQSFPYGAILSSVLVLTVLQLVSQLVICIQFFIEYDDVTPTEITQMAGDILYVIFRYGVLLFGAVCLFYLLALPKTKKR